MSAQSEYYLASRSDVSQLELLEITHSQFSKAYRLVRNAVNGITVTLEDGVTVATFDYYPLKLTSQGFKGDLDNALSIVFGDVGEVLPAELDRVQAASGFAEKPKVRYWTYRSDVLTSPLFGPIELEVTNVGFNQEGATLEAKAPSLNVNRTGRVYSFERFPMLKGFL